MLHRRRRQAFRWFLVSSLFQINENAQAGVPNYFESSKTFVYKRICVYDAPTSDLLSHADEAVKFIASGLCHGSVLVHCQQGVSRSTTCVAFYLMRKEGMTLNEAMKSIRETRPDAQPIPVFMEQLSEYETKCFALGAIQGQATKKRRIAPPGPSRRPLGPDFQPCNTKSKRQKMIGPSIGPSRSETSDPLISPNESAHQLKATQSSPDIGPSWPNNQN